MTQDAAWLLEEKYHGEKTEGFFTDCARLATGEPLAYVIGWVPFLNTTVHLDSHPLIPRTETEYWVERAVTEMKNIEGKESLKMLDLCAGSGCIGVAVLKNIPNALVDFGEIDVQHHPTIQKNIFENAIDPSRAHIFYSDLFERIPEEKYDYILTNPPYIDPEINRADDSVKQYEPSIALYGGLYGTELILKIIETAPEFLTERGVLYIEHEPEQSEAIRTKAHSVGFGAHTHLDQFGVARYTQLVRNRKVSVT